MLIISTSSKYIVVGILVWLQYLVTYIYIIYISEYLLMPVYDNM